MLKNYSQLRGKELSELEGAVRSHRGLGDVLVWAKEVPTDFVSQIVAEVVTQDEFTHDVIVPFRKWFLVYDTT